MTNTEEAQESVGQEVYSKAAFDLKDNDGNILETFPVGAAWTLDEVIGEEMVVGRFTKAGNIHQIRVPISLFLPASRRNEI